jgi:hypothetical protein
MRTVLLAVPAALALLAAPAAHADWYRHGGWGGPRYAPHYAYHGGAYYHGGVVGPVVAGALVLGAVAASVLAPPVVYAPPPVYYAPPPVYYAPPPVVYAPPAYYRAW